MALEERRKPIVFGCEPLTIRAQVFASLGAGLAVRLHELVVDREGGARVVWIDLRREIAEESRSLFPVGSERLPGNLVEISAR
jgi:hypothetical protein